MKVQFENGRGSSAVKKYKRIPWMRNTRTIAWYKYGPSNQIIGGDVDDDKTSYVNNVPTHLDGKRPQPTQGPTLDCFNPFPTIMQQRSNEIKYKDIKLLMEVTNQFVKVFLFYNSKTPNECFFIEENTHTRTRFYSQRFSNRTKAKQDFTERRRSIRWLRHEPL